MAHGIVLLGANGCGKSTLGRELAHVLNFTHLDVEKYWFYQTNIPYTAIRPQEERIRACPLFTVLYNFGSYRLLFSCLL